VNYYYLIATLPELQTDLKIARETIQESMELIRSNLDKADEEKLDYLLYPYDNRNIISLILSKRDPSLSTVFHDLAVLPKDILNNYTTDPYALPAYMAEFITEHMDRLDDMPVSELEQELTRTFYQVIEDLQDPFLTSYFNFDANLRNISLWHNSEQFAFIDRQQQLMEVGDFDVLLSGMFSQEFDFADDLKEHIAAGEPVKLEKYLDLLRWEYAESLAALHYFDATNLWAYVVKLGLLERWRNLREKENPAPSELAENIINQTVSTNRIEL